MKFASATNLNRKSGVAYWRDLQFLSRVLSRALTQEQLQERPCFTGSKGWVPH